MVKAAFIKKKFSYVFEYPIKLPVNLFYANGKKKNMDCSSAIFSAIKTCACKNTNLQPLDGAEEYTTSPMTFGAIKWP